MKKSCIKQIIREEVKRLVTEDEASAEFTRKLEPYLRDMVALLKKLYASSRRYGCQCNNH